MNRISSIQDQALSSRLQCRLHDNVSPHRDLGPLGEIAIRLGLIQRSERPQIVRPHLLVFAGDHGVAAECVSSFPQTATQHMVRALLDGRATPCAIGRQLGLQLSVVDAGINADLEPHPLLVSKKVGYGTRNFALEDAMNGKELERCLLRGAEVIDAVARLGSNVVLLGDAGVGSTTTAAALMHAITGTSLAWCVGAGSGVGRLTQARKQVVVTSAMRRLGKTTSLRDIVCAVGGFEIAMLAGAILRASEKRMAVVVDGFVTAVAALIASRMDRNALDYCIFSDVSEESGHRLLLASMEARPLLPLSLHHGEGLSATLAFPMIAAACAALHGQLDMVKEEELHG